MNIYKSSIGVEIIPSALRIARLLHHKDADHLTMTAAAQLCYRDYDDLYQHPKTCGNILNDLCRQNNIQAGRCIATLPIMRGRSKCIALPLMRPRALSRMLANRHFWYKHLGVGNDTHSYAWLTTVYDKKQYRLSLYLMAIPTCDIAFYQSVFAHTQLSLNVLTFSSLTYYGIHRLTSVRRLLIFSHDNVYLNHLGENVFSYLAMLSDDDREQDLLRAFDNEDRTSTTALRHLSELLQERLRSEKEHTHTLYTVGNINRQTTTQLNASLNNIVVKPLDIYSGIKLASGLHSIPDAMTTVVSLARCLASNSAIFKHQANFIHNYNVAYYKSAACWILSTLISVILFFYYQHLEELRTIQQPQLQHHTQLSTDHNIYKKKLATINQRSAHLEKLYSHIQFLSEQHRLTTDLWSRLGALIPPSIKIESIDCRWESFCLITAEAQDYGVIIRFVDRIKQLNAIAEVTINSSRTPPHPSADTMQFTLLCKFADDTDK